MYDEIVIPDELAGVHYKVAIKQRNRWIVEHCDVIIDCTYRDFGGAYTAIQYAKKAGKRESNYKKIGVNIQADIDALFA